MQARITKISPPVQCSAATTTNDSSQVSSSALPRWQTLASQYARLILSCPVSSSPLALIPMVVAEDPSPGAGISRRGTSASSSPSFRPVRWNIRMRCESPLHLPCEAWWESRGENMHRLLTEGRRNLESLPCLALPVSGAHVQIDHPLASICYYPGEIDVPCTLSLYTSSLCCWVLLCSWDNAMTWER